MPNDTHNLTTDERRALPSGAVVSWRGRHLLAEQVGTVDMIGSAGGLILCDGTRVAPGDFCRLIRATPTPIRECAEGSRPRCSEAADDPEAENTPANSPPLPQDAPKGAEPPKTPAEEKPPAMGQETPLTTRRVGKRTVDRGLWLQAVRNVVALMAQGRRRADAVASVGALPKYAGLTMTVANYGKWVQELRADGHDFRRFTGGTNMPKRKKANAAAGIVDDPAALSAAVTRLSADLLSARTELANLKVASELVCKTLNETSAELKATKDHCDTVIWDRDQGRAELANVRKDLAEARTSKPAGITPPPLGKGAIVSCRWEFAIGGSTGSIEINKGIPEHYLELGLQGPLQLDPAEFTALAQWADDACRTMDRASGEGNQ